MAEKCRLVMEGCRKEAIVTSDINDGDVNSNRDLASVTATKSESDIPQDTNY